MTETKFTKEQKKKMSQFFAYMWVPFYLITVDSAFTEMYLVSLGNADKYGGIKHHPAYSGMFDNKWLSILLMLLLISLWYMPVSKFLKTSAPELRIKLRRKISHIYRDMGIFFGIVAVFRIGFYLLSAGTGNKEVFLWQALPALALSLLAQACMTLIYVDGTMAKNNEFLELLYETDELYRLRAGVSIPLYIKVTLLVIFCAVIPLTLVYVSVARGVPLSENAGTINALWFVCSITLLVGLGFIFNGIQKPINGLIAKMKRVSEGDYNVKTRVYFSDEVARLKSGFNYMVDGLKEREELRDTFGKYMSIEIARELLKNRRVNLGGEEVEAAVMFCDIRNFTPISEKMRPAQVVDFLNAYFSYITPPISANRGVINKFIGDGVMAIYTPFFGSENYAADAVLSALEMRNALKDFNASDKSPGQVRFGIGIQIGKLVAGNIGTLSRLEYTFIGDTVNIASRLESKTKEVGTDILISKTVAEKSSNLISGLAHFEPIGPIALKGKTEPLEIYKVI